MSGCDPVTQPAKPQSAGKLAGVGKAAPLVGVESPPCTLSAAGKGQVQNAAQTLPMDGATLRPQISELEQCARQYVGTRYAIAVGSCAAALCTPLVAIGVGSGDEVIMSPLGGCALANIVVRLGAIPVFADVDTDYNMNPDEVERRLTSRTRAIVPMH